MIRKDDKGGDGGETTWTHRLLEGHGLAEDSTTQANLEAAC